ncbi:MAG: transposase [Nanoarchaeota archaeon]|nr:transposase [Nanoarchaeota archaeon]MBU4123923.1 transposase [Nanoarchaeota archaeon]
MLNVFISIKIIDGTVRKCIVLNNLDLTAKKTDILNKFTNEYLRVLDNTCLQLPVADSSNDLHHLTYSNMRKTSFLPSDIIEEARKDIWKDRKGITSNGHTFTKCSIRLNKRWFRYIKTKRNNPCFKITYSPKKNFTIPIRTDKQFQRFGSFLKDGWIFDNISLLKNDKIAVVFEKEFTKPEINRRYVLGIDVGSSTLAAVTIFDTETSKVVKQLYFGKDIVKEQRKYSERRNKLKSLADKGSHRARQNLEKLKHKQFNFVKTRSGQIAKEIINLARSYNAYISVEKLKNLKGRRGQFNKNTNNKINRIPYGKFKEFLKSNCEMFQISLYEVDAYHTSKWCHKCGALNNGHHSGNYSLYKCRCGLIVNSDRKASLAVAVKSVLERTKTHSITNLNSVQISNTRVPVDELLRSDDIGLKVAVQHNNQSMESHHF